jgi:hypothetical protein
LPQLCKRFVGAPLEQQVGDLLDIVNQKARKAADEAGTPQSVLGQIVELRLVLAELADLVSASDAGLLLDILQPRDICSREICSRPLLSGHLLAPILLLQ